MFSVILPGSDFVVTAVCVSVGLLAVAFFVVVFTADAQDAKRRAQNRKAIRRDRKD
jgi:hypothetical protein